MPHESTVLRDISLSVSRPIIFGVLKQMMEKTGLSSDTRIYYEGLSGPISSSGTSIDQRSLDRKDANFNSNNRVYIEVDETSSLAAIQEFQQNEKDHLPVFLDEALGVSLRPTYITKDVEISVRYQSDSETEVQQWAARMLLDTARGVQINYHSFSYTYPLPYPFVSLLEAIWTLRENVEGYGEDFATYVSRHSSERLTMLSNLSGERRHLAIRETQGGIQGYFDFVGLSEKPVRDKETGTWTVSFTYKFSYERPEEMFAEYPISIHNQRLPSKYTDGKRDEVDYLFRPRYYSRSYGALQMFNGEVLGEAIRPANAVLNIPSDDDFQPSRVLAGTGTVFHALCFLDDGRKDLLSLHDLGNYVIDKDIMEFLIGEAPYLLKPYHSIVNLAVYTSAETDPYQRYEVMPDLMLRGKEVLSARKQYHVRMSLVVELNLLTKEALDRLRNYPKAFVKLVAAMNDILRLNPGFHTLYDRNHIEPWQLTDVIKIMTGETGGLKNSYLIQDALKNNTGDRFLTEISDEDIRNWLKTKQIAMLTVQNLWIVVKRKE